MIKRRIAIPLAGNVLSEHFGHCQAFAYVDVDDQSITKISLMNPPEHQPGTFPRWVADNGATDVIAGGMGPMAVNLFNEAGVNVFVGAPIDSPANLVNNFLANKLTLNANYCDHKGDDQDHEHHHGHHDSI
jgi:predicted Fe-Mo cluster-binding NifX family protein